MKTLSIVIDGITIDLTQEQIAKVESSKKPKWFEYIEDKSYFIAIAEISIKNHKTSELYLEHGRYRLTKEAAEQSLERNKRTNRLEALAEQLGGLRKFGDIVKTYNIYFSINSNSYQYGSYSHMYEPEKVYMTEECSKEICRMLNEGEFIL